MQTMSGSMLTFMNIPSVMMFGLPSLSTHVARTTGDGGLAWLSLSLGRTFFMGY
jgi:hypothetical protein